MVQLTTCMITYINQTFVMYVIKCKKTQLNIFPFIEFCFLSLTKDTNAVSKFRIMKGTLTYSPLRELGFTETFLKQLTIIIIIIIEVHRYCYSIN